MGLLLDKADQLQAALPAIADESATRIHQAGVQVATEMHEKARMFHTMLERERELLIKPLNEATQSVVAASAVVEGGSGRIARNALLAGLAGGILGGAIAGAGIAAVILTL